MNPLEPPRSDHNSGDVDHILVAFSDNGPNNSAGIAEEPIESAQRY